MNKLLTEAELEKALYEHLIKMSQDDNCLVSDSPIYIRAGAAPSIIKFLRDITYEINNPEDY